MAYKVNGNVIIDDSGNVTLTNFSPVTTPNNISPSDGEIDVAQSSVTLELSTYFGFYKPTIPLKFAQFQVANVNTFAAGNIVYDSGNAAPLSSNTIPITLPQLTTFYWRGRYINNNDVYTEFSNATSFTTVETPPTVIGQSYGGGIYTGVIDIGGGTCYYLVVSPASEGMPCCAWKPSRTTTGGSNSSTDGYANTYGRLDNADHPAGNWTATRTINGYSDWYLPSTTELSIMYGNKGSMPVGETYPSTSGDGYWSSNESFSPSAAACVHQFDGGTFGLGIVYKNYGRRVRAVRRSPKI